MALSRLLIATGNQGKMREYQQLLRDLPLNLVSLADLGITDEVEETGQTFHENAFIKASGYARQAGLLTLADDSGLEVDALGGEPGVRSARYGGDACATDSARVDLLLANLNQAPWERRTARFLCVIAIATPSSRFTRRTSPAKMTAEPAGEEWMGVVGSVAGMIQYKPEGEEGFGYDPVFYLPSYGLTMAQLPLEEKNLISHRADASRRAVAALRRMAA